MTVFAVRAEGADLRRGGTVDLVDLVDLAVLGRGGLKDGALRFGAGLEVVGAIGENIRKKMSSHDGVSDWCTRVNLLSAAPPRSWLRESVSLVVRTRFGTRDHVMTRPCAKTLGGSAHLRDTYSIEVCHFKVVLIVGYQDCVYLRLWD